MKLYRFLLFAFLAVTASAHAQSFAGNPDGDLLPAQGDLPLTGGQIQNGATNGFTVQHTVGAQSTETSDVICGTDTLGTTKFQYGGFTGKSTGANDSIGGMMIRGGFVLDTANFKLATGHSLGWVQRYKETGGAGTSTIDSTTASPIYHDYTVPDITTGLVDIPYDTFATNTITSIDFESVLVCWDDSSPKDLYGIGSFLWGYSYDNPNSTISSTYAGTFTPPITGTFTTLFDNEYGATGTKGTGWSLTAGCDSCFEAVPEPAAFAGVTLGLVALARRRPRRS